MISSSREGQGGTGVVRSMVVVGVRMAAGLSLLVVPVSPAVDPRRVCEQPERVARY